MPTPEENEKQLEKLKGQLNFTGARLLKTQEQLTAARNESRRNKVAASLIRDAFLAYRGDVPLEQVGANILKAVTTHLNADRALALDGDGQECAMLFSLGDGGEIPSCGCDWPLFSHSNTPDEDFKRWASSVIGLPHFLWGYDPESRLAILVGRDSQDNRIRLPFSDDHKFLVEGTLHVIIHVLRTKEREDYIKKLNESLEIKVQERTRELLAAKETAEEATKLKDKFISLVSHDLRSPLASLSGGLNLVLNENLKEEHKTKMMDRMSGTVNGMLDLIDKLLDITRLQTGKISVHKTFINLWALAGEHTETVRTLAERKGVTIENRLPRDARIYADRTLFGEVLHNLVTNALKFTPSGGTITLYTPENGNGTVTVQDTGAGIPAKVKENLFKHDVRTTTLGTDGEKGTGLGLPFCADIMHAHGGEITVESTKGEGSRFTLALPDTNTMVMLVDDLDAQRLIAKEQIRAEYNAEFLEAGDGEQALKMLKDHTPHIIITDLEMPKMDGFTLLRELKKDPALTGIPVIVATSSASDETEVEVKNEVFRLGAADFVRKPLQPGEFIPRLKRFLK